MNDILIVLIALFLVVIFKYRTKKHRENLVSVFEKSHAKFAVNGKSQAAFQKAAKEWERKHPIKALKRRIKRLFW